MTDWEIENEMHQANTLSKRKPRKRIPFFMSRSILGILAAFTSILALIGLMLVTDLSQYVFLFLSKKIQFRTRVASAGFSLSLLPLS
ncbi:hypothetical protein M23134_00533 [Microscilla marina ATCC 23134]|uniref:Uncharacterized protein n=1 Tax=Microscilla marina ATCC 23134 TaxID=313606 RepID=A1ZJB3_MICM2|nr:hypothetical protein M23134_00533 [Microscilla marina ATCC 23134]